MRGVHQKSLAVEGANHKTWSLEARNDDLPQPPIAKKQNSCGRGAKPGLY